MPHQADLTDSCKIRPAPREDGVGSAGRGAARRRLDLKSAQLGNKSDCAIRLRDTWHDKLSR
jgi:hypothetical protein